MSSSDSRPCPYCGELIKISAIKCRFCGEFLQKGRPAAGRPPAVPQQPPNDNEEEAERSELLAWLFPVGNNIWAMLSLYLGILALIPFPILGFLLAMVTSPNDADVGRLYIFIGCGLCLVSGIAAIIIGIVGLLQILQSDQPGLMRAVFGVGSGLIGSVLYPVLFLVWFIPTFLPK
jgi:hypothetical protein